MPAANLRTRRRLHCTRRQRSGHCVQPPQQAKLHQQNIPKEAAVLEEPRMIVLALYCFGCCCCLGGDWLLLLSLLLVLCWARKEKAPQPPANFALAELHATHRSGRRVAAALGIAAGQQCMSKRPRRNSQRGPKSPAAAAEPRTLLCRPFAHIARSSVRPVLQFCKKQRANCCCCSCRSRRREGLHCEVAAQADEREQMESLLRQLVGSHCLCHCSCAPCSRRRGEVCRRAAAAQLVAPAIQGRKGESLLRQQRQQQRRQEQQGEQQQWQ